ncbi:S-adenosylmethionine-dependent methyltransferase, putative [Plasmodium malariae]|uniref:S-adenosylmethionine-dependent methyltransferase, putative n=1 Tax=Plasmodium malariae TaxID=5858 RepID=A0A1A8WAJ0_PLAMA|nr:S-adenosylmethionine-dependent methyltransferase, putative [Plasmodium malariae]SBS88738.1 S-adenosylmethionine-dependent methyltransferase, putative [Plasmodium malariae]SCO94067.1 S-adenosylmethionine-dependent methyltransferase, putative [Plasmodium malariae]
MVTLYSFIKDTFFFFLKRNCNYWLLKRNIILCIHSNKYHTHVNYFDRPVKRPTLIVNEKCVKNILNGFPWIYSKDVKNAEELFLYSPCLVNIKDEFNENIGIGIYNKNSTIASRILTRNINDNINEEFFNCRIKRAYKKRLELFPNDNFFRVVNAESDSLPGIVIDKFNKLICVQINASGMDILSHVILKSIENVLTPDVIILKNDNQIRKLEKLPLKKEVYKGLYTSPIEVRENGLTFFVDILRGQKTGWYYDQRYNRSMLISYCKNKNVLDLFSYTGSFGITLAYYGANEVTCVDSSYLAIQNGIKSAQYNNVLDKINFVHSCVKKFFNVCLHVQLITAFRKGETSKNGKSCHLVRINQEKKNNEAKYFPSGREEQNNEAKYFPGGREEQNNEAKYIPGGREEQSNEAKYIPGGREEQNNEAKYFPDGKEEQVNSTKHDMNSSEKSNYINKQECEKGEQKLFSDIENIFIYEKSNSNTTHIEDIESLLIKNNNYDFFKKKYDVILIDPPALARNSYLLPSALKVYEKLLYISFKIMQKPGYVFVSSCNKLVGYEELILCIRRSLNWSNCEGTIIGEGRISSDHPIHVSLPETKYLTSVLLMVT